MRAEIKVRYHHETEGLLVSVRDKLLPNDVFQECFRIDRSVIDMGFDKHVFVSAHSGMALNNHHYLYGVESGNLDILVDMNLVSGTQDSS